MRLKGETPLLKQKLGLLPTNLGRIKRQSVIWKNITMIMIFKDRFELGGQGGREGYRRQEKKGREAGSLR